MFQIRALVLLQNFIRRLPFFFRERAKHLIQQGFRQIIYVSVGCFHLAVRLVGIYAERDVARQRPGRRRPRQKVSVLPDNRKPRDSRAFFNGLVALRDFLRRQRRTAARAVRDNFKSLVQ